MKQKTTLKMYSSLTCNVGCYVWFIIWLSSVYVSLKCMVYRTIWSVI